METKEYDAAEAKAYILEAFRKQGDFLEIVDETTLAEMVAAVLALDEEYMHVSGADDEAVYDDDAAFDFMHEKMNERYPAQKMYLMRFVEDYMDYNEAYLDSVGLIDWE